jgi:phosphate-selective porin OprO/OprP
VQRRGEVRAIGCHRRFFGQPLVASLSAKPLPADRGIGCHSVLRILAISLLAASLHAQDLATTPSNTPQNTQPPSDTAGATQHPSPAPIAGYDSGGFFLQTPDESFRFTIQGLLQVRGLFYEPGLDERTSEFTLNRMRFELGGAFHERYLFHVEPNFSEDDVELEEAWIGADLAEHGPRLLFGRMKEPFSLEEMLPLRHMDFPTFSILNQFVPAEDHGVTLLGGSRDAQVEYGAALYNGTGGDDLNSDKDVAGRFVARPWAEDEGALLRRLQFGGAVTYGREDGDLEGTELVTETKAPFAVFEPGATADGDRLRLGLEAAWLSGPFALQAEAIQITEDLTGVGGDVESETRGWYAAASWVLTGEDKLFSGVKPRHPLWVKSEDAGKGALQLALRYSDLELDEALVEAGLLAASSFPESVRTLDVGLNWYATANAKVMVHFVHTEYAEEIEFDGDARSSEDALLVQLHLQF